MSENNELVIKSNHAVDLCRMTSVGVVFPQEMTIDEWMQAGEYFRSFVRAGQWIVGDWINFGEAAYGEKYSQALKDTDYSLGRLRVIAHICRKIPIEIRRATLDFSMHEEVCKLDEFNQEMMLSHAEQQTKATGGKYSVREFREHIKTTLGEKSNTSPSEPGGLPDAEAFKNALIYIRDLLSEKKISAIPTTEEVQWLTKANKAALKACTEVIGTKR